MTRPSRSSAQAATIAPVSGTPMNSPSVSGPSAHAADMLVEPPYNRVSPASLVTHRPLSTLKLSFSGGEGAGRGFMKLFQSAITVLLKGCVVLAPPDEHHALVIQLSEEAFLFLEAIQYLIRERLVDMADPQAPSAYAPVFTTSVRRTVRGDKCYIKTKLRLTGRRMTVGMDIGDLEPRAELPVEALIPGTIINCVVAFDGIYTSPQRTGLVTRLEMFRVINIENRRTGSSEEQEEPEAEDSPLRAARNALCMRL